MLAIGISYEHEGFSASRITDKEEAQEVADFLENEFGIKFDSILIIKNDEVIQSYQVDKHFD